MLFRSNWIKIIGSLAPKVFIYKIYNDTIVLGVCDSSWMQELYMISHVLKQKLNALFDKLILNFNKWKEELYNLVMVMDKADLTADEIAINDDEIKGYYNKGKTPSEVYFDIWQQDAGNFRNIGGLFEEESNETKSSVKKDDILYHKTSGTTLKVTKVSPETITMKVTKVEEKTPKYIKVGQVSKKIGRAHV